MRKLFLLIASAFVLLASCQKVDLNVPVSNVTFITSAKSVLTGETAELEVVISPADATDKTLRWATSNDNIVSVNQNGEIKGIAPGQATVTVVTHDGGLKDECTITVKNKDVPVTGIKWTGKDTAKDSKSMSKGGEITLEASVLPDNATNKNIIWTSSDNAIVAVDESGKVSAVVTGRATVVATTEEGGYTATCEITVTQNAGGLSLNHNSLELKEFEQSSLIATITPDDATDKTIIWSSSDETVAAVSFGVVTAKKPGKCTITASTLNGEFSDNCIVTVTCPVHGVDLNDHTAPLPKGATLQLHATVYPDRATNKTILWESSNEEIATVDDKGVVTGIKVGETVITARSEDDKSKSSDCKVTVFSPVSSISINPEQLDIYENDSQQLELQFNPADASNKEVNWTSRDKNIAKVDDQGKVTGLKAGKTEVDAISKEGGNRASCRVNVYSHVKSIDLYFKGTKISDGSEVRVFLNDYVALEAVLQPKETILDRDVTWTSSDTKVLARYEGEENFQARSLGTAVLTVTSADGGITASCKVVVVSNISIALYEDEVNVTGTTKTVPAGNITELTAKLSSPDGEVTDKRVTWTSSDTGVATVDGGRVRAVSAGSAVITATSVAGATSASMTFNVRPVVSEISLDKTELPLEKGANVTLAATVIPEDAYDKTVTWSSSNETVATVDQSGKVVALKSGTANIIVKSVAVPSVSKSCKLTVTTPVESVQLDYNSVQLEVSKTKQLTASILPEDADNKNINWTSSDPEVVTVVNGLLTGVKVGSSVRVFASSAADPTKKAWCDVTVVAEKKPVSSVTFNETSKKLNKGETFQLTATVLPTDATDKSLNWKSSDQNVVSVDGNGLVTAVAEGNATVTATANDGSGKSASCAFTIVDPSKIKVESLKFDPSEDQYLELGHTLTINPIITPGNASDKTLTWSSDDKTVATVENGVVTPVKVGVVHISAVTNDGSNKRASLTVRVVERYVQVTGIEIRKNGSVCYSTTMGLGEVMKFEGVITPSDATNQNFTWTRNQGAVGDIAPDGKYCTVTAGSQREGVIVLRAISEDGGKSFTCQIDVKKIPLEGIKFHSEEVTVQKGKSVQLVVDYIPSNATDKDLYWTFGEGADQEVVNLSGSGVVSGKKAGSCKIVAKSKADSSITAECTVTVVNGSDSENLGFEEWN